MRPVTTNKQIDTILITQLSDEDATVIETKVCSVTFVVASMYFDINRPIDDDFQLMQAVITHAKGLGIVFAIDSKQGPHHGTMC